MAPVDPDHPHRRADPNVILALERTMLAWTRTSLALMGFGFVAARLSIFLRELNQQSTTPGGSRLIGIAFVALGGLVQGVALVEHARSLQRLERGESLTFRFLSPATVLGGALLIMAVAVAVYLTTL